MRFATIPPMDCEERNRLTAIHKEAVKEWAEAGGADPMKTRDPKAVAAQAKRVKAEQAVVDHRKAHGC